MNGAFGIAGPYREDPGSALQRTHREREADHARLDRACKWIAATMVGRTFGSRGDLTDAACALLVRHYGRALTADEHEVAVRACRVLASGLCFIQTIAPARCLVDRDTHAIRFLAA
jgi:hypothetical protein